ncbi:hypothetical protein [Sporosarcina sp. SAFN-015]|uniref:hypothetical protein n=1 Tax=Sporosarcina sp. SAFN-015 TaxID=3387274 RepID=UPI003F7EA3B1
MDELDRFTPWSGPFLVRIMGMFPDFEEKPIPLGSGGLLKYRGRHFVITNHHVIKNIVDLKKDIRIPYSIKNETYSMTVLDAYSNSEDDIAIIEIKFNSNINISNHAFVNEEFIEYNIRDYVNKTNIIFIHGYPSLKTTINYDKLEIEATTFPYCTFIDKFDEYINSLFVLIDETGVSKFQEKEDVPNVSGMSGSFVYGYYYNQNPRFKLIGDLTSWDKSDSTLEVYPISEFTDFIDKYFYTP